MTWELLTLYSVSGKEFPQSAVDVTAFIDDVDRGSWHSHCARMDEYGDEYCAQLTEILVLGSDFDMSTLSKPSGPFGAVLYIQWYVRAC